MMENQPSSVTELSNSHKLKLFMNQPKKSFSMKEKSNESVIKSIVSVAELHTKPHQRNCNFKKFETKLILGWNGPNVNKSR